MEPFVGLSRKKVLLTGLIQQTCEGGAYVLLQPPEGGIMVQGVLQRQDDTEDFFQPKRGGVGRCEWEVGWETSSPWWDVVNCRCSTYQVCFFWVKRSLGLMVEKEKKTLYHTNLNTVLD